MEKTQWWKRRRSGGAVAEEMYAAAGAVKERVLGIGVLFLLINSVFLEKGGLGEGEPWLLLAMFGHTSITLY